MTENDYHPCEPEALLLNDEERADPYLVIHDFFNYAKLPEVREALWEWVKATVTGDYHTYSRREKASLVYLYERIEHLIEASHIIHERTKKRPSE